MCTVATSKPLETNGFQIKEALKYKKTCVKFQMMNEFHDARKKKVVHKVVVNLFALVVRWFFYQPTAAAAEALKPSLIKVFAWEIKHIFTAMASSISDWLANLEWLHLCISTDLFWYQTWQMSQFYQMSKQVAAATFNIHVRNFITGRSYFFKKVAQ